MPRTRVPVFPQFAQLGLRAENTVDRRDGALAVHVGGGIVAHAIGPLHHAIEDAAARADAIATVGPALAWLVPSAANAAVGLVVGAVVLLAVLGVGRLVARARR